jgi:anaerobic dimethyl sulfoxide reductase subunit B (iron-sulfur subunit)
MEHDLPPGQFGIKVFELGPWCYDEDKWQYRYIPVFTDQCNLCAKRQAKGKLPTCVKHCQSQCIRVARHDEIVHELSSKRRQFFMTV